MEEWTHVQDKKRFNIAVNSNPGLSFEEAMLLVLSSRSSIPFVDLISKKWMTYIRSLEGTKGIDSQLLLNATYELNAMIGNYLQISSESEFVVLCALNIRNLNQRSTSSQQYYYLYTVPARFIFWGIEQILSQQQSIDASDALAPFRLNTYTFLLGNRVYQRIKQKLGGADAAMNAGGREVSVENDNKTGILKAIRMLAQSEHMKFAEVSLLLGRHMRLSKIEEIRSGAFTPLEEYLTRQKPSPGISYTSLILESIQREGVFRIHRPALMRELSLYYSFPIYIEAQIQAMIFDIIGSNDIDWHGVVEDLKKTSGDNVMLEKERPKGGIDLTSDKALSVQNNGQGIKFHINPAQLKELEDAPGFVPVIISIRPMSNIRMFLGLNTAGRDDTIQNSPIVMSP